MLPPHELKPKEFTRAIRGYSATEVDEHIDYLVEQYTALYRENDELERKLRTAQAELEKFKGEEESIRYALVNAQKASAKITRDANERAEIVLRATKTNCDRILSEFRDKIVQERELLTALQNAARSFKAMLVNQYGEQIRSLENLTEEPDDGEIPDDEYIRSIIASVKEDVARLSSGRKDEEEIVLPLSGENGTKPSEKLPAPADEEEKDDGTVTLPDFSVEDAAENEN